MAALAAAGLLNDDGNPVGGSHSYALDVIGSIAEGGVHDEEGNVITPPHDLPGWHVNFLGVPPEGWAAYEVHPQSPCRLWLGEVA